MTSCTTRSGSDSVFVTSWWRGRNGMMTAITANAMRRPRKMIRKRRSISSEGDQGNS
jgi:hypothetical protein